MTAIDGEFAFYASPMETDPEHPEIPISYPRLYAAYLTKLLGPFAVSSGAGDEAALYAGAIESEDFQMQVKLAQEERERLFFSSLEHQPSGVVTCVFDTPARIERVFGAWDEVIGWSYREVDRLVGRTLDSIGDDAVLLMLSNHARGVVLSNRKLNVESAAIEDIAPTVLQLFGISQPDWMRGRPVLDVA
jgi:hypothetical protein